jgi:hypothetical protein
MRLSEIGPTYAPLPFLFLGFLGISTKQERADMGGIGSGGWNATGRSTTATALRLDVNVLRRHGCLDRGWSGLWGWSSSTGESSRIGIEAHGDAVTLRFTVRTGGGEPESVVQRVTIEWQPCRFGGVRPFWLCPVCSRRIVILHGVRRFACRTCNRLSYASQRERRPDRAQRRANKIRVRLGGQAGLGEIPPKPPRMHARTYDRLVERVIAADAETLDATMALLADLERRDGAPNRKRNFWL